MLYTLGWLAGQFGILFGLLKCRGLENVPKKGGAIIAANHRAYIDPPVLGFCLSRGVYYLAKKELYSLPLAGWLIKRLQTIPISRRDAFGGNVSAHKKAINLLHSGGILVLFPEGTRSRGEEFLEPKLGIGLVALEAGVPIVPAYIENSGNLWMTFLKGSCIMISFGKPIKPDWLKGRKKDRQGYREVAQEVMERIGDLRDSNAKKKITWPK